MSASSRRDDEARTSLGDRLKTAPQLILLTAIIGLLAGLAAVGFRISAEWLTAHLIEKPSGQPLWIFAGIALIVMFLGALITGILMARFAPDAPGSGIPQVKLSYSRNDNRFSINLLWVKFVGGVLSIGSGSSLGREGPTIHIGAAIASLLSRLTRETDQMRANGVCAGSAAGLAAAFNSPLAGVTLVLEEITNGRHEGRFAARALLAAALAVMVIHLFSGDGAALPLPVQIEPTPRSYFLAVAVALAAAVFGLGFQGFTLWLRGRMKRSTIPTWLRPALGALAAGIVAVSAFALTGNLGVFGLGEKELLAGLNSPLIWQTALILAGAKLLATALCYGTGGCGGIFAPILFFGAFAGSAAASGLSLWFDLSLGEQVLLMTVGISASLAAVVRAPITSILIVLEMTRELYAAPVLMIGAVVGVVCNIVCFRAGFYDAALNQDGTPVD